MYRWILWTLHRNGIKSAIYLQFTFILLQYGSTLKPIFHCDAKPFGLDPQRHNFALGIQTCWDLKTLKFALPPTPNLKLALPPTPTPNASQWNIGCVESPMQNFCIGHVLLFFGDDFIRVGSRCSVEYGLKTCTMCGRVLLVRGLSPCVYINFYLT